MTRTPRVAVAGAGLGGLAAAAALARQGLEVAVYEQRPRLPEDETALHLAPNGSRILQRWGLGAQLLALAVQPVALEFREWSDGSLTWRQPLAGPGPGAVAAPYCTLLTDELYDLLLARLPQERIRLGRRLSGFRESADGVELEFADGGSATPTTTAHHSQPSSPDPTETRRLGGTGCRALPPRVGHPHARQARRHVR